MKNPEKLLLFFCITQYVRNPLYHRFHRRSGLPRLTALGSGVIR